MNSETGTGLKIRVLNASKRDLTRDLQRAVEFDQSQLFKKIYENEFGTPGGEPYGALIGDYEWTQHPDDVETLRLISNVAAGAFAPFISAAGPGMFGFESWTELAKPRDLAKIFETVGLHQVAQLPRQRGRALRQPGDAAHAGPPALRRRDQADRRVQLRRSAVRRGRRRQVDGPRPLLLDERRLRDGHPADRRVRQVRLLHRDPRRRGRRQGGGSADPRVHLRRRRHGRQVPDRDRPSPTGASSSCPTSASCRCATTRTPTIRCSSARRPCRSRRSTTGRRPPPTRRSRPACPTSWRPAASPTT